MVEVGGAGVRRFRKPPRAWVAKPLARCIISNTDLHVSATPYFSKLCITKSTLAYTKV